MFVIEGCCTVPGGVHSQCTVTMHEAQSSHVVTEFLIWFLQCLGCTLLCNMVSHCLRAEPLRPQPCSMQSRHSTLSQAFCLQKYVQHIRKLASKAKRDPSSGAAANLEALVSMRVCPCSTAGNALLLLPCCCTAVGGGKMMYDLCCLDSPYG